MLQIPDKLPDLLPRKGIVNKFSQIVQKSYGMQLNRPEKQTGVIFP